MKGSGKLILTGKLGDVMKESARAAMSYLRSRADVFGLEPGFHADQDLHIHVPEGAIPKDGPSAGITMASALISALLGVPVRGDVAMTGEITLRGKVLPVGGIKDKVLAAYRAGIFELLLPKENEKDLEEVPEEVREEMTFHLVESMDRGAGNRLRRGRPQGAGGAGRVPEAGGRGPAGGRRSLAARGESPTAFERPYITSNIVALRSNMARYAPSSRLVGRAPDRSRCERDFHHGLLGVSAASCPTRTRFGTVPMRTPELAKAIDFAVRSRRQGATAGDGETNEQEHAASRCWVSQ